MKGIYYFIEICKFFFIKKLFSNVDINLLFGYN